MNNIYILGAFKNNEIISASVFMYDDTTLYYWMNLNSKIGRNLQASYLIIYEIIKYFSTTSIIFFDMGYSHNDNISRPKRYWGAKKIETYKLNA